MPRSVTNEQHQRVHTIELSEEEVLYCIAMGASEAVEHHTPNLKAPGVSYKVTIDQVVLAPEGGIDRFSAVVTITEDLMPQVAATGVDE